VADLLYIATIVAFFALMVAFVRLCERIVGKDDALGTALGSDLDVDDPGARAEGTTTPEEVPA